MIRENIFARFWNKTIELPDGCIKWTAYLKNEGYGQFVLGVGRVVYAHRWIYEQLIGSIPKGLQIDHLCRNRACVNVNHMEVVTRKENILRGISIQAINASKTHCKYGHEFNEQNTYLHKHSKGTSRQCRSCHRIIERGKYRRKIAEGN